MGTKATKILILGGTGEARALAAALVAQGHDVTTSLAGRTTNPVAPAGGLRIGGFGGVDGLACYLSGEGVSQVVDATHPYAAQMSANAVHAAAIAGVKLLRLMRPAWQEPVDAPWRHVADVAAAAHALPHGGTALITSGHGGLEAFFARQDCRQIVRLIESPAEPLPWFMTLLLDRPPYDLATETALMRAHGVTHVVSKNSGGVQTSAKLDAARELGIGVIMIDRPAYLPAPEVTSVEAAFAALA